LLAVEVSDRFGAEGVVGGVWLDRGAQGWVIRNFVLSCRVLSRGVEQAVLQYVADCARQAAAVLLEADFRPTERNAPAAALYPATGFVRLGDAPGDGSDDGGLTRYAARLDDLPILTPDWITLVAKEATEHV
jgi:predicted enzyme involved in methoxymalonyl-ACP biosynthesis